MVCAKAVASSQSAGVSMSTDSSNGVTIISGRIPILEFDFKNDSLLKT